MAALQQLQEINLRVTALIKEQQQLRTKDHNWEQLYKETNAVQKNLIAHINGNAQQTASLITAHTEINSNAGERDQRR